MSENKSLKKFEIPLDGKLITSIDPSKIGPNYQQLVNMRYTPGGPPKGIGGMTKITSAQINGTYYKVRSGIHYHKDQPSESHVLVEAYNSALSSSRILQNVTAIPSAGNFSATSLYTPSGSSAGRWSLAPDGDVAYCNGEESCVWGGAEREVGGFISYDPNGTFLYDYTVQVRNTKNDAQNNAVLNATGAGLDANTMLFLPFNNNVTDSSPTTAHTVANYARSDGSVGSDHCTTLTGWNDLDNVNGETTQVSFGGYETFRLDANNAGANNYAEQTKDFGVIGDNIFYASIRVYHAALGDNGDDDAFHFEVETANMKFYTHFATDGLFVTKAAAAIGEVGTNIVDVGSWAEWTFIVDATTPATATVEVFKNGVSQGTVDCDYEPGGTTDGLVTLEQEGVTTADMISYVDWVKIGTGSTEVTFSTTKVFGTHSAVFDGSADWLQIPDDADFDFSGGTFTIDGRLRVDNLTTNHPIWYQQTDLGSGAEDYFYFYIDTNGAIKLSIYAAGAEVVACLTANGVISAGSWYHIALVENASDWYIFVDGHLEGYVSDAQRAANYTSDVLIGRNDGATPVYYDGYIDEFRVSDSARWTSDFEIPTETYSTDSDTAYFYIGSVRPLDGFKLYMDTGNTSASTMTVYYWNNSAWTSVSSLTDNTDTGASLAQTGTVTFTSTVSTAKLKYINGVVVYWYKVVVDDVDSGVDVYHATVSTPFQPVLDIWDGIPVPTNSFQIYNSGYQDNTLNVRENIYVSSDSGTYSELHGLQASGVDYFVLGFSDRTLGVYINFVSGKANTTDNTILTVKYWTGVAWVSVGSVDDGTIDNGKSLAKTGAITWNVPESQLEFTREINNSAQLYYYKFEFSKTLAGDGSDNLQVYHINGIPAQKQISDYKFPFFANDRLLLCSDQKGKKNSILVGAQGSSSIFNGYDTAEYTFGDEKELMGGAWLYSQYGSSIFNVILFFKKNEIWALVGNGPEDWVKYRVSNTIGCIDPETIKILDMPPQASQTLNRSIVKWRASDGIYMSDGRSPIKLSDDIDDKFEKRQSTSVNNDVSGCATWDTAHNCYHYLCAAGSSTTLDEEWVLDLEKPGWFQINRTTDKKLQYAMEVQDTNGATYLYGFNDEGYMYRLDYGNTFDGQAIAHTMHLGDMVLAQGSIPVETDAEYLCLMAVAKTTTTNNITFTHYGDSKTSGTTWTQSPQKTGHRLIYPVKHQKLGAYIFHSVKMVISTDDETTGFEPLYFYVLYSDKRDHIRDWR